ncbi:hypothetical protein CI238_10404 [Colletotrichum incanum]|uniref:Ankyrin repeat protein n=1 Tax=Colletotrichum incanum TaxID=1573173 RepID=A0A162PKP9_COLIC|nr:hypothetical protein CI238_10404 [Colletotrichum incanum]
MGTKIKTREAMKAENVMMTKTKARMKTRSKFLTLTQDVMHLICEYLEPHDILQLVRTTSIFNAYERSLILHNDMVGNEKRALLWACSKGDIDFARKCLELGYDPNYTTSGTGHQLRSILKVPAPVFFCRAIMTDHPAVVSLLYQYGGRFSGIDLQTINSKGEQCGNPITPFHLVRSKAMVQTILQLEPNLPVDSTRWTANEPILTWMIVRGASPQTVRLLLEAGAHPSGARPRGPQLEFFTPHLPHAFQSLLEAAVFQLDVEMVRLLLNRGASFKYGALNGHGHTHLHCVLSHYLFQAPETYDKSIQIFEACVNHGLDPNRRFRFCSRYDLSNRSSSETQDVNTLFEEALTSVVESEILLKSLIDAGAGPNTRIFCYRDGREKDALF